MNSYYKDVKKTIDDFMSQECFEKINKAFNKQYIALPPIWEYDNFGDGTLVCPTCQKPITNVWSTKEYKPRYCHYCGQKLKWE